LARLPLSPPNTCLSLGGGVVVDHLGVSATMWVGAVLAAVSLIVIANFGLGSRDLRSVEAA
jgi:predicted MFS family arabinose efflux permease